MNMINRTQKPGQTPEIVRRPHVAENYYNALILDLYTFPDISARIEALQIPKNQRATSPEEGTLNSEEKMHLLAKKTYTEKLMRHMGRRGVELISKNKPEEVARTVLDKLEAVFPSTMDQETKDSFVIEHRLR